MKKCEKGSAFYGVFLKTILRGRAKIKIMESAIDSRFHYCSTGTDGFRLLCHQSFPSSLPLPETCLKSSKTFLLKMNKLREALLL